MSKPLDQIPPADLATKDELADESGSVRDALWSGVGLIMGEFARLNALMDETERYLAQLVAKSEGGSQ
ncbi:hypothetical protein ACH35V_32805 [Actinomadura sp. 1N219]|uniref:hypothetical protein n=1 Tax=Actinomadura sp. 1N219 TaxID=3375152 RepID=UPI0037B79583